MPGRVRDPAGGPRGADHRSEDAGVGVRVVLAPIGTPLPLGFLGLAAATVLMSALQLEWLPPAQGKITAVAVLGFTVPLQLIACIFGFRARDAVAGTGMGLLAGTWVTVAVTTLMSPPGATSAALGVLLLVSALCLLVPAAAAAASKIVPALVIGLSAIRFALTGAAQLDGPESSWAAIAAVTGLLLGALAIYAALALELEDTGGRTVLPIGRRGAAQTALCGSLVDQVREVQHEAGVRNQL